MARSSGVKSLRPWWFMSAPNASSVFTSKMSPVYGGVEGEGGGGGQLVLIQ